MDDQTREAISTVAHRVAARILATYEADVEWENYPDIGEGDWQRVVQQLSWLAGFVDRSDEEFDAAYEHLAKRAEPQRPTVVAWVTVDENGRLTAESMVTVGEWSRPVPERVDRGGVMWWPRVGSALRELGWRPVREAATDDSRPGVIGVAVEPVETKED